MPGHAHARRATSGGRRTPTDASRRTAPSLCRGRRIWLSLRLVLRDGAVSRGRPLDSGTAPGPSVVSLGSRSPGLCLRLRVRRCGPVTRRVAGLWRYTATRPFRASSLPRIPHLLSQGNAAPLRSLPRPTITSSVVLLNGLPPPPACILNTTALMIYR